MHFNKEYGSFSLIFYDEIVKMFNEYNELQQYKDRRYMFIYSNGKQLKMNDMFDIKKT